MTEECVSSEPEAAPAGRTVRRAISSEEWRFLTSLRGAAALFVTVSHAWFEVWPAAEPPLGYRDTPPGWWRLWTGWLYHGHFAVVVFIVLSGFSLEGARISRGGRFGVLGFLKRRARRILPTYYAAMVLSAVIGVTVADRMTGSQWDISIPVTFGGLVVHTLMLQDFAWTTQINYTHWSIAAEFQLYLLFPLFLWLFRRHGEKRVLAAVLVAVYGTVVGVTVTGADFPAAFLGLVFHFAFGMAVARLALLRGLKLRCGTARWAVAAMAAVVVVCTTVGFVVTERYLAVFDFSVALATGALLLGVLGRPSTGHSVFVGLFHGVGRMSYTLYLIHAPFLHLTWLVVASCVGPDLLRFVLVLLAGTVLSVLASAIFFRWFERPFLRS